MTTIEKLLIILVPLIGLTLIFIFFNNYVINLKTPQSKDTEKLSSSIYNKNHKTVYKSTSKEQNNYIQSKTKRVVKNQYPTYQNNQQIVHQQPIKFVDAETLFQKDLLRQKLEKQKYQNRLRDNKLKIQAQRLKRSNKSSNQNCSYILRMKRKSEEIMKRKYKAYEYQRLESSRKHWAKIYRNNCFNR
jgi:hypothetical protein